MEQTDIVISGAGIAGMIAAAGLAHAGYGVTLVDPAAPVARPEDDGSDMRSTAYLQPSRDLMDRVGVWQALAPHATPLRGLRVVDTAGDPPRMRTARLFQPADLGAAEFGWNIANWRARAALADLLRTMPGVDLRLGIGFAAMTTRTAGARVTLSDGSRIAARLVVGADGHASPVRQAAGIAASTRRYGQSALAFAVTHAAAHEDVSTEIYAPGGAFTTVPMADHDGAPASAIVWMNDNATAATLMQMADAAFDAAATARSLALLGAMHRVSPRRIWPVVTQTADALTATRCVLIAEAAHVLPPIGAQGLNTSLRDVAALLDALEGAADPGDPARLDRYSRARRGDVAARAAAIDVFNRTCKSAAAPVAALRRAGLATLHDIAPLRRAVMRAGLGA